MKKRLIASCAAVSILMSMFSAVPALADETDSAAAVGESIEIVTEPETESAAELMDIVASGECGNNLTWTLDDTGTLTISGTGKMPDWELINGYPIPQYHSPWYDNKNSITNIIINDGVTNIGNYAFSECVNLTNVRIPESVTAIGECAFRDCGSLTSIVIPDGVTSIGSLTFFSCESLISVNIPDGVSTIERSTFFHCISLTGIKIPDSVTAIETAAFQGCSSLSEINIPDSVTSIGNQAFYYCESLTDITIPDSVTTIGDYAFEYCSGLTEFIVGSQNAYYTAADGVLFNASKTELIKYPEGKNALTYSIPDGVTTIGHSAFYNCINLTGITIPDSVASIGEQAFEYSESLTSFSVNPQNPYYTSVDDVLFNIEKTRLIKYPAGKSATTYSIPDSVTAIDDYAFTACSDLVDIKIPDGVTAIGNYGFYDCTGLIDIAIPDSVTTIGKSAFSHCFNLINVRLPDSITAIGEYVFYDCTGLTDITIPDSVTIIDYSAFRDCSSLTSISIPDSVTTIKASAFRDCSSLSDVYYDGTEEEWGKIEIGNDNDSLLDATIHYGMESDIVMHYADGVVSFEGSMPINTGAVLIQAIYTSEGRLDRIETHTVENVSDTVTIDTDFTSGASKLMLWDGFKQTKPLADEITL